MNHNLFPVYFLTRGDELAVHKNPEGGLSATSLHRKPGIVAHGAMTNIESLGASELGIRAGVNSSQPTKLVMSKGENFVELLNLTAFKAICVRDLFSFRSLVKAHYTEPGESYNHARELVEEYLQNGFQIVGTNRMGQQFTHPSMIGVAELQCLKRDKCLYLYGSLRTPTPAHLYLEDEESVFAAHLLQQGGSYVIGDAEVRAIKMQLGIEA